MKGLIKCSASIQYHIVFIHIQNEVLMYAVTWVNFENMVKKVDPEGNTLDDSTYINVQS